MRATVDLHNDLSLPAKEIHEVVADWCLPHELQVTKLTIANSAQSFASADVSFARRTRDRLVRQGWECRMEF